MYYPLFYIPPFLRSNIIRLGIKKQPVKRSNIIRLGIKKQPVKHPYRRSRAGRSLFYRIHSMITSEKCRKSRMFTSVDSSRNLIKIETVKQVKPRFINLSLINTRSICNKIPSFQECLLDQKVDVCIINESWLKEGDILTRNTVPPVGYKILSKPRLNQIGGGIAIIYSENIAVCEKETIPSHSLESALYTLQLGYTNIDILTIYRLQKESVLTFCDEFATLLEHLILSRSELIVLGDMNIHMDVPTDPNTIIFNDFLDSFGLVNHVNFPTQVLTYTGLDHYI